MSRGLGDVYKRQGVPYQDEDLAIPEDERDAVRKVVEDLDLRGLPPREVLARVRQFFAEKFEYTLYQDLQARVSSRERRSMAYFLETSRRGHCEYFATAGVLILREAGIPARYATGFAVREQSEGGEWLLRGQHGHAWCRVYLGGEKVVETEDGTEGEAGEYVTWEDGQWVNFDPTPGDWLALEGAGVTWEQRIKDWWQRARQEVLLWRTQEGIRTRVSWAMGGLGALVFTFLVVRLWRGHLVEKAPELGGEAKGIDRASPLRKLIRPAEKILGPRPAGQPMGKWLEGLRDHRTDIHEAISQVTRLYWKGRFDSLGLTAAEESQLKQLCRSIRRQL